MPTETGTTEGQRVVWITHKSDERCGGCGAELFRGNLVQISRDAGIRCMACAGLADLVYLPAGDQALTRRALAASPLSAIVVKFSRHRKRSERQGVLVAAAAIETAKQECERDAARREQARERRRLRDEAAERAYVAGFAERVLQFYPGCPRADAEAIARHACQKYSGRVGRSTAAKQFDTRAITLAVQAHIRHQYTNYDELLAQGLEPFEARPMVADSIQALLYRWRGE
jgi:hypothetical protein